MAPKKAYFLVKNNDYAPDKLIQLGQIIADLKAPHARLSPPFQPLPEIHPANETDYLHERSKTIAGLPGVFTSFAAGIVGAGADVSVKFARTEIDKWRFDKLETTFIEPDADYVNKSIEVGAVKTFLEHNKILGRTVYMITGIKVARGAQRLAGKLEKEVGTAVKVSFNAANVTGVPVEAGPTVSLSRKTGENETFSACSDFVFAYRLRRVTVRWGRVDGKEVTGADLLGKDDDRADESEEEEEEEEEEDTLGAFEAATLDKGDYGAYDTPNGFVAGVSLDGDADEECLALLPKD